MCLCVCVSLSARRSLSLACSISFCVCFSLISLKLKKGGSLPRCHGTKPDGSRWFWKQVLLLCCVVLCCCVAFPLLASPCHVFYLVLSVYSYFLYSYFHFLVPTWQDLCRGPSWGNNQASRMSPWWMLNSLSPSFSLSLSLGMDGYGCVVVVVVVIVFVLILRSSFVFVSVFLLRFSSSSYLVIV